MAKTKKIETTEDFIEKWRERTCLWDVTSTSYRDRDQKKKAHEEIDSTIFFHW